MWKAIANAMINPNNISNDSEGYNGEEVYNNIKSFWKIMDFVVLGSIIIVTPISFDYYEDTKEVVDLYDELDEENKDNKKKKKKKKNPAQNYYYELFFMRVFKNLNNATIFNYLVSTTMRPF